MINLDATTKSLEIKLAGAVATTELPFVASYVDISQATFAMTGAPATDGVTNGATAVTAAAAPAASTTRKLNFLSVVNVDTAAVTLTVQVNNSGTKRIVFKATLAVGDQVTYVEGQGWSIFDTNGNKKTTQSLAANSVTLAMLAQIGTASVLGRNTAGTGNVEVLTTIPAGVLAGRSLADLGTRAVANLSDGSNVALLNAANTFSNAGAQTIQGYLKFDTNSAGSANGTIFKNATNGLEMIGVAGSSYDFSLWNPAGMVALLVNPTGTSNLTMAGILTVSGFGAHTFSAGAVGQNTLNVINTNSSTTSLSALYLGTDASTTQGRLFAFSTAYTTSGPYVALSTVLEGNQSGGVSIAATHASGAIRFYSGGMTLRATLGTGGLWQWNAYGAGALSTDASGNITASDGRFKERVRPYAHGLAAIQKLRPIAYHWNKASGWDRTHEYVGFVAQNVRRAIPGSVPGGLQRGKRLNYDDRAVMAATVNAIKELHARIAKLERKAA